MNNFLLEKIALPIGDLILKSNFVKSLNFWRSFDSLSELELISHQEKQLKNQLLYAQKHISKYKGIKINLNKKADEIIKSFPILTKDDLRSNPKSLQINNNQHVSRIYSSGSTGVSTWVSMNKLDLMSIQSLSIHLWELCGYKLGNPILQTGISPKRSRLKKMKDLFFGVQYVSAFTLSTDDHKKICSRLSKNNKYTLVGYPSSLNIIAEYIIENNINLKLKTVIGLGDKLFDHYKKNIQKAFGCKIHETYGSSEGFQIGFQADLDYMYLYTPQVYLELLDDNNNPVKEGEIGNVVVTRLENKHMPLIRYKLGDLAIMLPKDKYPPNRKFNFPLIEKVIGRNTDVVILPDNRKLIVHSFTGIFEYIPEIKQFKIIQKNRKSMTVQFIPDDNFTKEVLKNSKLKLQKIINNNNFKIYFEEVSLIEGKKSGKPQIIESYIT
mgnify:FL=1